MKVFDTVRPDVLYFQMHMLLDTESEIWLNVSFNYYIVNVHAAV